MVLCACGVVLLGLNVYAVDLRNEDTDLYRINISRSDASTAKTSIDGSSTQANVCSDCEIEVVGVGKIQVKGSEVAVIKDGKLSKQ
jgi:hypothetical protein